MVLCWLCCVWHQMHHTLHVCQTPMQTALVGTQLYTGLYTALVVHLWGPVLRSEHRTWYREACQWVVCCLVLLEVVVILLLLPVQFLFENFTVFVWLQDKERERERDKEEKDRQDRKTGGINMWMCGYLCVSLKPLITNQKATATLWCSF